MFCPACLLIRRCLLFCQACLLFRRWLLFCHPEVDDVGSNASWRTRPKTHFQLIADIISRGRSVSPLLAVPWVHSSIFRVDWLHCADLGVSADYLGNLFWSVLPKLPGRSRKEQVSVLWIEVQHFYTTYKVCDKLQHTLVETMIRKDQSSPPKLRGKAAEIRALVPFGVQLAEHICRMRTRWKLLRKLGFVIYTSVINHSVRIVLSVLMCYSRKLLLSLGSTLLFLSFTMVYYGD